MSTKRKSRDGGAEDRPQKRRKVDPDELNSGENHALHDYFSNLPREIFTHILSFADDPIATQILSMTCKKFNEYIDQSANENRLWHSIYLKTKFHVTCATVKNNSLLTLEDVQFWENMNKLDGADLTLDSIRAQQELYNSPTTYIQSERECEELEGYSPEWYWPKPLELSKENYDPSVNYRELAIDCWWKKLQFELFLKLDGTQQSRLKRHQNPESEKEEENSDDDDDVSTEENNNNSSVESQEESSENSEKENRISSVSEEAKDEEDDESVDMEPRYLEHDVTLAFLREISGSDQFGLFLQILSGAAAGHMPALDYEVPKHSKLNCSCSSSLSMSASEAEQFFELIKQALKLDSIICMQHIICALYMIGIIDILYLHELASQNFPYLATIYSVYNIEQHFLQLTVAESSFFFLFNADLDENCPKLPDWLALNQSMFRLMRRAGMAFASPNATGYAIETLRDYIKTVISTIIENKKQDPTAKNTNGIDVDSSDVQKALISMTIDNAYDSHNILYREHEWLNENELMMYSDSECETYESSYEDSSVEDEDLSEYSPQEPEKKKNMFADESLDDEDICALLNNFIDESEDYTPLNELLKQQIPSLSKIDDSQLFINTAIRHAQIDEIKKEETIVNSRSNEWQSVADEKEHELDARIEHFEPTYQTNLQALEGDELAATWVNICLTEEAYYYHGTTKLDSETIDKFIAKYGEDIPINELSEEKQAQVLEIRRETNRLLKEQFLTEKNEFEKRRWQRVHENYDKYCKEISQEDLTTCKSLEIDLTVDNELIKSIIERAIKIIPQCTSLKTVKIRSQWIEEEFNYKKELTKLFNQLSKCRTLEALIVTDDQLPEDLLVKFLTKKKLKRFHYSGREQINEAKALLKTILQHQSDSLKDFYITHIDADNLKAYAALLKNIRVLRTASVKTDEETINLLKEKCPALQRVQICNIDGWRTDVQQQVKELNEKVFGDEH